MGSIFSHVMSSAKASHQNSALKNITAMGIVGAGVDGALTYAGRRAENPDESQGKSALIAAGTAAAWLFAEPLMWGITIGQGALGTAKMFYEENQENEAIMREHAMRNSTLDLQTGNYKSYDEKGKAENKMRQSGSNEIYQASLGGNFRDSETAATLRQRQLQNMRQSRMMTENILGSEARQLHR